VQIIINYLQHIAHTHILITRCSSQVESGTSMLVTALSYLSLLIILGHFKLRKSLLNQVIDTMLRPSSNSTIAYFFVTLTILYVNECNNYILKCRRRKTANLSLSIGNLTFFLTMFFSGHDFKSDNE